MNLKIIIFFTIHHGLECSTNFSPLINNKLLVLRYHSVLQTLQLSDQADRLFLSIPLDCWAADSPCVPCFSCSTGPVVCQPRRQQQHAQPHPQLSPEDPLPARTHHATHHGHVPAVRSSVTSEWARHQQSPWVFVSEYDRACLGRRCRPNLNYLKWGAEGGHRTELVQEALTESSPSDHQPPFPHPTANGRATQRSGRRTDDTKLHTGPGPSGGTTHVTPSMLDSHLCLGEEIEKPHDAPKSVWTAPSVGVGEGEMSRLEKPGSVFFSGGVEGILLLRWRSLPFQPWPLLTDQTLSHNGQHRQQ